MRKYEILVNFFFFRRSVFSEAMICGSEAALVAVAAVPRGEVSLKKHARTKIDMPKMWAPRLTSV